MSTEQLISSPMGDAPVENEEVQKDDESYEIDVIDDVPEDDRDRRPPVNFDQQEHEDELKSVGKSVQKRIKKLKYDFHEERRGKESAARMRDEAVSYAKKVADENRQLRELVNRGEKVLIDEVKARTEGTVRSAKDHLKKAHEDGDYEAIADAQELLARASYDAQKALEYSPVSPDPAQAQVAPEPEIPARPTPDPKAATWAQRNSWFQSDREMTAFAFAVHEGLVSEGISPSSDSYYSRIDQKMRERFPEKFGEQADTEVSVEDSTLRQDNAPRRPSTVGAPARRTSGVKGRKVRMTKTQVALAKRLGITPEQYAKQVMELEKANG